MNDERRKISAMFDRAESLRDYPGDYFPALMKAKAALKAWDAKYPDRALAEQRAELIAQAEREERLSGDASTYDADGWLDKDARDERAAKHMARAAELRKQAAELK